MTAPKRKLIEVALPLEAINRESAREKSIRHGHPSTLHLWWARRPLAACRAVLFAQLVDDPSARPEEFPTEEAQVAERKRLFELIERLVVWENINDESLFKQAHEEILKSTGGRPPAILDPFAGGGSIPLEAQRLGLEAHASDLNPVAVLINKALIEIPPKWAGRPPVFPGAAESRLGDWPRATGLAEDVRRYGQWIRDEAEKRIGHLYPAAALPDGASTPVLAWIWARTVTCPNPACGITMPLIRSFWLGKKKGREAYVVATVGDGRMEFEIGTDLGHAPTKDNDGTVTRTGAVCLACKTAVPLPYIRAEGKAQRIGAQLMATVAEGRRHRIYLAPTPEHEKAADVPVPEDVPDTDIPHNPRYLTTPNYGMTHHADLFTARQLVALTTLSNLVHGAHQRVLIGDAVTSSGGGLAYSEDLSIFLALAFSRTCDLNNSLVTWSSSRDQARNLFSMQAVSMTWDYVEVNPFGGAAGDLRISIDSAYKAIGQLVTYGHPTVTQEDALKRTLNGLVCSDPPYYDNVGYADLSDFFYVWLRRSLRELKMDVLSTVLTPKTDELVADPFRHGGEIGAGKFFEHGFREFFAKLARETPSMFPVTVFYAFKQAESDSTGTASSGWQTLLEGMLEAGWQVTATWPVRTERGGRSRDIDSNALASSIVLALRPRPSSAEALTRRAFLATLRKELPPALSRLREGGIAPVDLEQAAIGPGMAIFSRHSRAVEADGSDMTVRTALALINQALDEVLSEQESDFDSETRFCLSWFTEYAFETGPFGKADSLARSKNTAVDGLERAGIFRARAGRARLLSVDDLPSDYSPISDDRVSVWEVVLHLAKALAESGESTAARIMSAAATRVDLDTAKELAYLLYSVSERRGWAQTGLLFNGLGTSWNDIAAAARAAPSRDGHSQGAIDFDGEE